MLCSRHPAEGESYEAALNNTEHQTVMPLNPCIAKMPWGFYAYRGDEKTGEDGRKYLCISLAHVGVQSELNSVVQSSKQRIGLSLYPRFRCLR